MWVFFRKLLTPTSPECWSSRIPYFSFQMWNNPPSKKKKKTSLTLTCSRGRPGDVRAEFAGRRSCSQSVNNPLFQLCGSVEVALSDFFFFSPLVYLPSPSPDACSCFPPSPHPAFQYGRRRERASGRGRRRRRRGVEVRASSSLRGGSAHTHTHTHSWRNEWMNGHTVWALL